MFSSKALAFGAALGLVLLLLALGASARPTSGELGAPTGSAPDSSYFGVDRQDAEAVLAKQRELAADQWRRMMGDSADIEQVVFAPDMDAPSGKAGSLFDRIKHFFWPSASDNNKNKKQQ